MVRIEQWQKEVECHAQLFLAGVPGGEPGGLPTLLELHRVHVGATLSAVLLWQLGLGRFGQFAKRCVLRQLAGLGYSQQEALDYVHGATAAAEQDQDNENCGNGEIHVHSGSSDYRRKVSSNIQCSFVSDLKLVLLLLRYSAKDEDCEQILSATA